jgi:hypothetical protein
MEHSKKKHELPSWLNPFDGGSEAISPDALPPYEGDAPSLEIEKAYDFLLTADTAEDFYKIISFLVFHARHISPFEHADIARLISVPFKRGRGQPKNAQLRIDAYDYAWASKSSLFKGRFGKRMSVIADLAKKHKTSIEIVGRAIREAEENVASEKASLKKRQ